MTIISKINWDLYLLIILSLLSSFSYGQWKTKDGSNKFDGNYKVAYVIGAGGQYPNNHPSFMIGRLNKERPSIMLSDIGYTGCDDNVIKISFDGTDEIFVTSKTSTDLNKEVVYIDEIFETPIARIIDLLKEKKVLYVRHTNSCSQYDYEFNLSGSASSIDYVVDRYYEEKKLKINEEKKKFESEKLIKAEKEETVRINMKNSFKSGVPKIPIISSSVVFNHSLVLFDLKNQPQLIKVYNKDSLIIYNELNKNRLLLKIKNTEGLETEYYTTKHLLSKMIGNISEFYAIEYLYNNWDDIVNNK